MTSTESPASLRDAVLSPAMIRIMPWRAWVYLVLYIALAAALLLVTARLLIANQTRIEGLILDYLFPDSWHFAAETLIERFFAAQHRVVIINAVVLASLMAVTLVLFPVKEQLSAAFESGARLVADPVKEHPLWEQGWQEVKLLALVTALQGTIFLLGFLPYPPLKYVAIAAGHLLVILVFAVDFLAPLLQRHEGHYSRIFKTLISRPHVALAFGAVFSAPTMIVGKLWESDPTWAWDQAVPLLFGVNVLCIGWAAASGTWLASRLYPVFTRTVRSGPLTRRVASALVIALLAGNAYVYGSLGLAVHHKSQLLKCQYNVDFSSLDLDLPGLKSLLGEQIAVSASVDVAITNPTPFDVVIENSEVVVSHEGTPVSRAHIASLSVAAGTTATRRLAFTLSGSPGVIARGTGLFDRTKWQLILYADIAPFLRMPIPIVRSDTR